MRYYKLTPELLDDLRDQGYRFLFDAGPLPVEKIGQDLEVETSHFLLVPHKERPLHPEIEASCYDVESLTVAMMADMDEAYYWLERHEAVPA